MRIGVASADLTPPRGVALGGYPYVDRANTGAHDPLHGGALYLESRGVRAVLIATDLFWLTRAQADDVRARVSSGTGVAAENVVVTCSHTHSAPWMNVVFEPMAGQPAFETRVDEDYVTFAIETCARLAVEAAESAFDGEIGYGRVTCGAESGIGGNRRDPEHGPADTDVPALIARDAAGTIRGVWTKYAVHPTILDGTNEQVSADFPGAMRAVVAERFPDAVFLYSMGTAGDQSTRYFRSGQTFDEVERFGRILGHAVVDAVEAGVFAAGERLAVAHCDIDLPVKTYPEPTVLAEKIAALTSREQDLIASGASYVDRQNANLWRLGAECEYHNAVKQAEGRLMQRYEAAAPFSVTAVAVGGAAWVFLPGEVFCEFGLDIKARSPFAETQVVTLSNGDLPGYCVTREALEIGGYEPGNSILAPDAGDILVDTALGLLAQVHED